jgi:septum formation protein
MIVLASTSATRRAMLDAAGIAYEAVAPMVDEATVKAALIADRRSARDIADALAELKALRVAARRPGAIVIGADQTLELDDGGLLDKPGDALADQLRSLSGRTHRLHSAAVAVRDGAPCWRHVASVRMTMRSLSAAFIADYVASEAAQVAGCVGGYRIEGRGAQLFSAIEGSHFAILGMPLLPLLGWLRDIGELAA